MSKGTPINVGAPAECTTNRPMAQPSLIGKAAAPGKWQKAEANAQGAAMRGASRDAIAYHVIPRSPSVQPR
jgi:hypothetical protein